MQQRSLLFLLAACVLQAAAAGSTRHAKVFFKGSRRALLTCEETYGAGSIPCGNNSTTFCYNPSLGQTCCTLDSGYCDVGTHCAPVAGYCCLDSETDATCADNAGFELPVSFAVSSIEGALSVRPFLTASGTLIPEASAEPALVTEATSEATPEPTSEVTLFVGTQTETAVVTEVSQVTLFPVTQTTVRIPLATGPGPSSNTSTNISATYIPSVVQVSVAKTEQTLMWTSIGIIAVALFMSSC